MKRLAFSLLGVFTLAVVWQMAAVFTGNDFYLPSPLSVVKTLALILGEGETYRVLLTSFARLFISLVIASALGVATGLAGGMHTYFDAFLRPFVSGLRTVPVISLVVIILILFGNVLTVYIIGFLVVFPLMYEATKEGVRNIDSGIKDALRIEPLNLPVLIVKQIFPLSLPYVKTGVLQSVGLGFKVLVMSEFIAQSDVSIGRMLYEGRITLDYESVFAWTLLIILVVFVIESVLGRFKPSATDSV